MSFKKWVDEGNSSCLFARALSQNMSQEQWLRIAIELPRTAIPRGERVVTDEVVEKIGTIISHCINNEPACDMVEFTFPQIVDEITFGMLIRDIALHTGRWDLSLESEAVVNERSFVGVSLRYCDPTSLYESWVLGFGPFYCMPSTRKAPHGVLILRTGAPGICPVIMSKGRPRAHREDHTAVHLADVRPLRMKREGVKTTWVETEEQKKQRLLEDPFGPFARARTTAVLPRSDFDSIFSESNSKI